MTEEQAILSAGTLVRERYMVKGVLGSGSTGMLYLVKDQKDPAPQAPFLVLKEISGLDQQARFDFTIRGTALHQLRHPALPRIHALLNDDKRGCIYLVMDYIDGERLTHVPWGHLNWLELRTWCEPLIAVLSYLHHQEQPLFHGDLKPENIVRHSSKKIMLVDPGFIQRRPADQKRPGDQRQPDCYRAPEQFAGMLDERSDVYGCGALLYTLLSGEEPVDALTRRERVKRKKSDPLVPPHKLAPHLSRELAAVLLRALALDPAARFASVREFWEALLPLTTVLETPRSAAQKNPQPAVSGSGIPNPTGRTPTEPRRAAALSPGSAPITPVPPVYSPPRPRRQSMSNFQRMLFPISAGVVALLILLVGAGAWAWGAVHQASQQRTGPVATLEPSGTPGTGGATPAHTSTIVYPVITGDYRGTFWPANENKNTFDFTMIIKQQQGAFFSGIFVSPVSPTQQDTVSGSIDFTGNLIWTVFDAAGNAILYFFGGLNGISSTQLNTSDSGGGTYYECAHVKGGQCSRLDGPGHGGSWVLNHEPSV